MTNMRKLRLQFIYLFSLNHEMPKHTILELCKYELWQNVYVVIPLLLYACSRQLHIFFLTEIYLKIALHAVLPCCTSTLYSCHIHYGCYVCVVVLCLVQLSHCCE